MANIDQPLLANFGGQLGFFFAGRVAVSVVKLDKIELLLLYLVSTQLLLVRRWRQIDLWHGRWHLLKYV